MINMYNLYCILYIRTEVPLIYNTHVYLIYVYILFTNHLRWWKKNVGRERGGNWLFIINYIMYKKVSEEDWISLNISKLFNASQSQFFNRLRSWFNRFLSVYSRELFSKNQLKMLIDNHHASLWELDRILKSVTKKYNFLKLHIITINSDNR